MIPKSLYEHEENSLELVEPALAWLKANGTQWLRETKGHPVYRGIQSMRGTSLDFTVRDVKGRARGVDSSKALTDLANDTIKSQGLVANRLNSVFVTGSRESAHYYGFVCIAVPSNGYKYTWSPSVFDMYGDFGDLVYDDTPDPDDLATTKRHMKWLGDDGSLVDAIKAEHEIMVKCDQVALFSDLFWKTHIGPKLETLL